VIERRWRLAYRGGGGRRKEDVEWTRTEARRERRNVRTWS